MVGNHLFYFNRTPKTIELKIMSEFQNPMYTMPMQPAGDCGCNNGWNNNPFAYLIWIYALRWMGFDNHGGKAMETLNASQIDALREGVGAIKAAVECGNANGMRFLEQIANETRGLSAGMSAGFNSVSSGLCDVKTAVLGQLSNMQWQISNDTASVVSAINQCCCATQNKIDNIGCGIEKGILEQTNVLQNQMAANQADTRNGFSQVSNAISTLGYAISQNDCQLRQLIASEGCQTRQLMRDLHTEDLLATKDQTISALQGKIYDYSQANLANTIISALKTTTTTTPTT